MNTSELSQKIAESHDLPATEAKAIVKSVIDNIQKEVKKGEKVSLAGFGTFERINRKARTGRNPYTGESVKVPAKKVPKFRPGKSFKELLASARGGTKTKAKAKVKTSAKKKAPKKKSPTKKAAAKKTTRRTKGKK